MFGRRPRYIDAQLYPSLDPAEQEWIGELLELGGVPMLECSQIVIYRRHAVAVRLLRRDGEFYIDPATLELASEIIEITIPDARP